LEAVMWTDLAGVIEEARDEMLLDVGRWRFHHPMANREDRRYAYRGQRGAGMQIVARYSFLAHRSPRRTAMIALPGGEQDPALLAWVDDAWVGLDGEPPRIIEHAPDATHGDACLSTLLDPTWARLALGRRVLPAAFTLAGGTLEDRPTLVPCLTDLSAERYDVEYEPALDVVTAHTSFIEGRAARRSVLKELHPLSERP
jgi:hypothetical protein